VSHAGTGGSDNAGDGEEMASWKRSPPLDPAVSEKFGVLTSIGSWMANGVTPEETTFNPVARRPAWASAPEPEDDPIKPY